MMTKYGFISVPDPRDPRADYQEIPMNHHDQDIKGKKTQNANVPTFLSLLFMRQYLYITQ